MAKQIYLAVDMGASNGRHVAGQFDGQKLEPLEVHRFDNIPVRMAGRMYWDLPRLWSEICRGLAQARQQFGDRLVSVGIDTWGVDFALLGEKDELLGLPYHYRDVRTDGAMERAFEIVPRDAIFRHTGLQFIPINSLYQIFAFREAYPALFSAARSLLMMPDLFHWLLTGIKSNEWTDATTTQLFDPTRQDWSTELCRAFGIPRELFQPVSPPGTTLGPLTPEVRQETGIGSLNVVLPGTHDTASAVMSVPSSEPPSDTPNWCYISSGTWSLMGVETAHPVLSEDCLALNFTNEGGVGGTTRLLKNISGLWILQECRRVWTQSGESIDWEECLRWGAEAPSHVSLINPDDPAFVAPADMPAAIADFCRRTGQPVPADRGAVVRCALESLALKYHEVLLSLEKLIGARIHTIHIVGGGSQNELLSQMAADACGREVIAGPVEATAVGNLLMQLVAAGEVASIAEARQLVKASFPVKRYEPAENESWDEAYSRFRQMTA